MLRSQDQGLEEAWMLLSSFCYSLQTTVNINMMWNRLDLLHFCFYFFNCYFLVTRGQPVVSR